MSIMIKGIDMPINCTRCPCSDDETLFCRAANKYIPMISKPNFCPLAEAEERKKGKWIEITDHEIPIICECSECEWTTVFHDIFNYCPNCGAEMREET